MPDYQSGKIYKIVNSVTKKIYIGSTVQRYLSDRMGGHRKGARDKDGEKYNYPIYQYMRKHGIENFRIELIEPFPCDSQNELLEREQYYIDKLKPALNTQKAYTGMNLKEYKHDHYMRNIVKEKERRKMKVACMYCESILTKNNIRRHEKSCMISTKHLI